MNDEKSGLTRAIATVKALRGENGCPWDKAQTHESLRRYLLEETHEVLEALDAVGVREKNAMPQLKEELGDLLLQVLLHSEIASESGTFNIQDVAGELADKLVRRHPHVFGDEKLESSEAVISAWEKRKAEEKKVEFLLDSIPTSLPALQRSLKVVEKVSRAGFQWPDLQGPLEKVQEELGEFLEEVKKLGPADKWSRKQSEQLTEESRRRIESELGDLLFCLTNVAYFLDINPEDALRTMLQRFGARFRHIESGARKAGKEVRELSFQEMDSLWNEAKAKHKKSEQ